MDSPLGLDASFRQLVDNASDGEDLYQTITERPLEEIVEFFDYAVDDSTWYEERGGAPFMREIFSFFHALLKKRALPNSLIEVIAKGVRRNIQSIQPFLIEDAIFNFQGDKIFASSILFKAFGGSYFSDLMDEYVMTRNSREISLEGVSKKTFGYIKEYLYSKEMKGLWKEEPKVILNVQKKSDQWNLGEISEYAARIYRNYVSEDVLLKRLFASFEAKNRHLTHELLQMQQQENSEFHLVLNPSNWFELTIDRLNLHVEEKIQPFLNYTVSLTCSTDHVDQELLINVIGQCSRLASLDLSSLTSLNDPISLIKSIPKLLQDLKLKKQQWVNNEVIDQILSLYHLRSLDLSDCENYQLTKLTELNRFSELETLSLAGNSHVNNQNMAMLCPSIKQIKSLNLSRCKEMTDQVLQMLVVYLKELKALNIASCPKVTSDGILQLAEIATIRVLNIKNIKSIPSNFKEKNQRKFWMLTKLTL